MADQEVKKHPDLDLLHQQLLKDQYAVPEDYAIFEKTFKDPANADALHKQLLEDNYAIPSDYNDFLYSFGLKKKEDPGEFGLPSARVFEDMFAPIKASKKPQPEEAVDTTGTAPPEEVPDTVFKPVDIVQTEPPSDLKFPHWTNVSQALGIPISKEMEGIADYYGVKPSEIGEPQTLKEAPDTLEEFLGKVKVKKEEALPDQTKFAVKLKEKPIVDLNDYLRKRNVYPEDIGLPPDVNTERWLSDGEKEKLDGILIDKGLYKPPENKKESYVAAVAKGFNMGLANMVRDVGYLSGLTEEIRKAPLKLITEATGIKEKVSSETLDKFYKKLLSSTSLSASADDFERIAKFLENLGGDVVPDDRLGEALKNTGSFIPDLIAMTFMPESKIPVLVNYGLKGHLGFPAYLGFKSYIEAAREGEGAKGATKAGITGVVAGLEYGAIGVEAKQLGEIAKSFGAGMFKSNAVEALANSLGFAAVTKAEGGDPIQGALEGLTFYGLGKVKDIPRDMANALNRRVFNSYLTATDNNIRRVAQMRKDFDPFKARQESVDMWREVALEKDPEKREAILRRINAIDNIININAATNLILKYPDKFINIIKNNQLLSEKEKKVWIKKISRTIEDADPRIQEAKPIREELNNLKSELTTWQNDINISEDVRVDKIKAINTRIEELQKNVEKVMAKPLEDYYPEIKPREIKDVEVKKPEEVVAEKPEVKEEKPEEVIQKPAEPGKPEVPVVPQKPAEPETPEQKAIRINDRIAGLVSEYNSKKTSNSRKKEIQSHIQRLMAASEEGKYSMGMEGKKLIVTKNGSKVRKTAVRGDNKKLADIPEGEFKTFLNMMLESRGYLYDLDLPGDVKTRDKAIDDILKGNANVDTQAVIDGLKNMFDAGEFKLKKGKETGRPIKIKEVMDEMANEKVVAFAKEFGDLTLGNIDKAVEYGIIDKKDVERVKKILEDENTERERIESEWAAEERKAVSESDKAGDEAGKDQGKSVPEVKPEIKATPEQQDQIDKINKEYDKKIAKKQEELKSIPKKIQDAIDKANKERVSLWGDNKPIEADEIIKREEQGFTLEGAVERISRPFLERKAELEKDIKKSNTERENAINTILHPTLDFAPAPEKPTIESVTERAIKFGIIDRDRGKDVLDLIGYYEVRAREGDVRAKSIVDKIPKEEWDRLMKDASFLRTGDESIYGKPEAKKPEPKEEKPLPELRSPEIRDYDSNEDVDLINKELDRGFKVFKTFYRKKGEDKWKRAYLTSSPDLTEAKARESAKRQLLADAEGIPIGRENEALVRYEFKAEEVLPEERKPEMPEVKPVEPDIVKKYVNEMSRKHIENAIAESKKRGQTYTPEQVEEARQRSIEINTKNLNALKNEIDAKNLKALQDRNFYNNKNWKNFFEEYTGVKLGKLQRDINANLKKFTEGVAEAPKERFKPKEIPGYVKYEDYLNSIKEKTKIAVSDWDRNKMISDAIYGLAGDSNKKFRQGLLSFLKGEKVTVAESGIHAIMKEVNRWITEQKPEIKEEKPEGKEIKSFDDFVSNKREEWKKQFESTDQDFADSFSNDELKKQWREEVLKASEDKKQLPVEVLESFAKIFGREDYLSTFRGVREQEYNLKPAEKEIPKVGEMVKFTRGGKEWTSDVLHVYPDGRVDVDVFGRKTLNPEEYEIVKKPPSKPEGLPQRKEALGTRASKNRRWRDKNNRAGNTIKTETKQDAEAIGFGDQLPLSTKEDPAYGGSDLNNSMTLSQISRNLISNLKRKPGGGVRSNMIKRFMRKAQGIFFPDSGIIRIKGLKDFRVLSHELGHWIDFQIFDFRNVVGAKNLPEKYADVAAEIRSVGVKYKGRVYRDFDKIDRDASTIDPKTNLPRMSAAIANKKKLELQPQLAAREKRLAQLRAKYGDDIVAGVLQRDYFKKELADFLSDIDFPMSARSKTEAIAEFVWNYIGDPKKIEADLPKFHAWFEKMLDAAPPIKEALATARKEFKEYAELDPRARRYIENEKKDPWFEGLIKSWDPDKFLYSYVNHLQYMRNLSEEWKKVVGSNAVMFKDPYASAKAMMGIDGRAQQWLLYHPYFKRGKDIEIRTDIEGLVSVLKNHKLFQGSKKYDDYSDYLLAKDSLESYQNRKPQQAAMPLSDAKAKIDLYEKQYGVRELWDFQSKVQKYNEALLDFYAESGKISKEIIEKIKMEHQYYVPLRRVFEEFEKSKGVAGTGKDVLATSEKGMWSRVGSERQIRDIFSSMIENTYNILSASEHNIHNRNVRDALFDIQNYGLKESRGDKLLLKEDKSLIQFIENNNVIKPAFDVKTGEMTWVMTHQAPKGKILSVWEDGKIKYYDVDAETYNNLFQNEPKVNHLIRVMSMPSRWLQAGAVVFDPTFPVRNIGRDQVSAWFYSKYGYSPVDFAKGIFSSMKKDDMFQKWMASGADQSFLTAADKLLEKKYAERKIGRALDRKWQTYRKNPLLALQDFSRMSEMGTRVGAFKNAYKKTGDVYAAALESRDISADYGIHGAAMRSILPLYPFLNARLQHTRMMTEAIGRDPKKFFLKGLAITAPAIINWLSNNWDDEATKRYQSLPEWRRIGMFNIRIPGTDNYLPLPKGFLGMLFASTVESALDFAAKEDPRTAQSLARELFKDFSPVSNVSEFIPFAIRPKVEMVMNKKAYTNKPIIPETLAMLKPEEQYYESTPEIFKKIGEFAGISPLKMDFYTRSYFGGAGIGAVNILDEILQAVGVVEQKPDDLFTTLSRMPFTKAFVTETPVGPYSSYVSDFYKKLDEMEKLNRSFNNHVMKEDFERLEKLMDNADNEELFTFYEGNKTAINKFRATMSGIRDLKIANLKNDMMTNVEARKENDRLDQIIHETAIRFRDTWEKFKDGGEGYFDFSKEMDDVIKNLKVDKKEVSESLKQQKLLYNPYWLMLREKDEKVWGLLKEFGGFKEIKQTRTISREAEKIELSLQQARMFNEKLTEEYGRAVKSLVGTDPRSYKSKSENMQPGTDKTQLEHLYGVAWDQAMDRVVGTFKVE